MVLKPLRKLRNLRQKEGLTQQELGELLGLTGSAISNIERGTRGPSMEFMQKVSELFDQSVDDIFFTAF